MGWVTAHNVARRARTRIVAEQRQGAGGLGFLVCSQMLDIDSKSDLLDFQFEQPDTLDARDYSQSPVDIFISSYLG